MQQKLRLSSIFVILATLAMGFTSCASLKNTKKQENPEMVSPISAKTRLQMPTDEQKSEIKLAVAQSIEQSGDVDGAIRAYSIVLDSDPSPLVARRLAVLHDQKGKHDKARKYYDLALEQGGDRAMILCDYGYSLYLQHEYALAESVLREALALREDFPRAHTNLALVCARAGNLPEALAQFRRAGCNDATARVNLSHALLQQQRWQEALLAAQDALRSDPRSDRAAQLVMQLQDHIAASQRPANPAMMSVQQVQHVAPLAADNGNPRH